MSSPPAAGGVTRIGWYASGWTWFLGLLLLYWLTDRRLENWDNWGVMYLVLGVCEHGRFDLAPYMPLPTMTLTVGDRVIPFFSVWGALPVLPAFLIASLRWPGGVIQHLYEVQHWTAHWLAALTGGLLVAALRPRFGARAAVMGGLSVGLGTINWFALSQTYFSNIVSQAVISLCLWLELREGRGRHASAAITALLVFVTFLRPNLVPLVAAWLTFVVWRELSSGSPSPLWRRTPRFGACVLALVATTLLMGTVSFLISGYFFGGYSTETGTIELFTKRFLRGLYANTVGPARGVFVFSPWTLLAVAAGLAPGAPAWRRWLLGLLALLLLPVAGHYSWFGGSSYGPRLTADFLPLLALLAAPLMAAWWDCRWRRPLVVGALALSIGVSALHAMTPRSRWDFDPVDPAIAEERFVDWRDPFIVSVLIDHWLPYESRFSIRPELPEHRHVVRDTGWIEFYWTDSLPPNTRCTLEISTFGAPFPTREFELTGRNSGSYEVTGGTIWAVNELDVPVVAWRVIGYDAAGRRIGRSGWRAMIFERPKPPEG